jgi:beta-1,4-mannosyltransferase
LTVNSDLRTIMAFPARGDSYTECFYRFVREKGAVVTEGIFSGKWLLANVQGVDFVHIHWPSFFYRDARRLRSLLKFAKFIFLLALVKARGARLVWTAHNLYPHDKNCIPFLDTLARRIVVRQACRIFVHGRSAANIVSQEFPSARKKLTVIPHGHWIGFYENNVRKEEARMRLGLPVDTYVYLFVGLCKPYKNVDGLIRTFQTAGLSAELIIAGKFQSPEYEKAIRELIARRPTGIRLFAQYIPDESLQVFLKACDVVVLPYTDILTSGSAMLAMTFGRPVVAPRLGHLQEIIGEDVGLLYEPGNPLGLLDAMRRVSQTRYNEDEILRRAKSYRWEDCANGFLDSLASLK